MKKGIKVAIISGITLVSGAAVAAKEAPSASASFVDEVCALAPLFCEVGLEGNGVGVEPKKPPKDDQ
ncbi:hypothetical protein [Alteromonas sp. CYL-A6]|uniref:hypothetical protein n=1 Tax=Alteromonas nitratireducens TaxID=3390813 RepID=UPI0034B2FB62